jgi:hypothetical protein
MGQPYKEAFLKGSKVQVISRAALEAFAREWKYHHKLRPEQMEYAGTRATVKEIGFYHGGDQLYGASEKRRVTRACRWYFSARA